MTDQEKAIAEIRARNDAVFKFLKEKFTAEERQKILDDNFRGADQ